MTFCRVLRNSSEFRSKIDTERDGGRSCWTEWPKSRHFSLTVTLFQDFPLSLVGFQSSQVVGAGRGLTQEVSVTSRTHPGRFSAHSPISQPFRSRTTMPSAPPALAPSPSTPSLYTAPVPTRFPEEIIDIILSRLDYDYSVDAKREERVEQDHSLSHFSVISGNWLGPARRLLAQNVGINSYKHLEAGVPRWAEPYVLSMRLELPARNVSKARLAAAAGLVFKLLAKLPKLRTLILYDLTFASFTADDSTLLRNDIHLPKLLDLRLYYTPAFPYSLLRDLLATSNHQIRRFTCRRVAGITSTAIPPQPTEEIKFESNLRYLSLDHRSLRHVILHHAQRFAEFKGLETLDVAWLEEDLDRDAMERFCRQVGGTLVELRIAGDTTPIAAHFRFLTRLSRLIHYDQGSRRTGDPHPTLAALLHLPPSLAYLALPDDYLTAELQEWMATPGSVPPTLKHVQVSHVIGINNLIPRLQTLTTRCGRFCLEGLENLTPNDQLPFNVLEMSFDQDQAGAIEGIRNECERLGIDFIATLSTRARGNLCVISVLFAESFGSFICSVQILTTAEDGGMLVDVGRCSGYWQVRRREVYS